MNPLCQYRDVFGKAGTGVHSVRLYNVAVLDVIGTIVGATVLARVFRWNVWLTNALAFLLAILAHRLFCVNTTVNRLLFGPV